MAEGMNWGGKAGTDSSLFQVIPTRACKSPAVCWGSHVFFLLHPSLEGTLLDLPAQLLQPQAWVRSSSLPFPPSQQPEVVSG